MYELLKLKMMVIIYLYIGSEKEKLLWYGIDRTLYIKECIFFVEMVGYLAI